MHFSGLLLQIYRLLYSIGRGSGVDWALSFPSKVCFLVSLLRYWWGSFYQRQKTVKLGPSTGWLKVDSDTFGQIEVIHQILRKERFFLGGCQLSDWIASAVGFIFPVAYFRDSHGFSFIRKCFFPQAFTVILPQLLEQRWVWVCSSSKNHEMHSWWPSRGIRFPSGQSGEVFSPSDRSDEILRPFALRQ